MFGSSIGRGTAYNGAKSVGLFGSLALAFAACGSPSSLNDRISALPDGGGATDLGLVDAETAEPAEDTCDVYAADVDQGAATLIRNNRGEATLIDCGRFNMRDRLSRFLLGLGVKKIKTIILTHPHEDHYGGCAYIATHHGVESFIYNGYQNDDPDYQGLLARFPEREIFWDGYELPFGNLYFAFYHPPEELAFLGGDMPENDNSLVMTVRNRAGTGFFIGGDIEGRGRSSLLGRYGSEVLDVIGLLVPHHGSRNGLDAQLLRATTPEIAVISAGVDNDYGHPHRETLDLLAEWEIETHVTARHGSIRIGIREDRIAEVEAGL